MPMDLSWIGRELGPFEIVWTAEQVILYALGVGADELKFATANSEGVLLQVLPTFVTTVGKGGAGGHIDVLSFGSYGAHQVVHHSQRVEVYRSLPAQGRVHSTLRVAAIFDKRVGAQVDLVATAVDPATGEAMFRNFSSLFILGEGGFGGDRGLHHGAARRPRRPADATVVQTTQESQALLYALSGDAAPIHTDPVVARRAGFERPILHGLCTFGFACRALLRALCGDDPARFRSMEGRFAKPTYPGDELVTEIWFGAETAFFEMRSGRGEILIERGVFDFAKPEA
jgi:acyl dehydratase